MTGLQGHFNMVWELVDIAHLRPHECTRPHRVAEMHQKLHANNFFHKPLLVDGNTMTILDGHHRYTAGLRLGLLSVPAIVVNYLEDADVSVEAWPPHDPHSISKQDVISAALAENLMPPKSTRHRITTKIPRLKVPLSKLRSMAS
ncbi:MAG: hypothetical protein CMA15_04445 [Euryarchaeota archaeon]|nr:hypothetical protein [Euryarchaeota archaeon]